MRKINKKILVAALSLLLVACAFVTILSFTMAADGDGEDGTNTVAANPSFDVVTVYNIDRIVQNSNSGADPYFHIVELSSSTNYSAMSGSNTSTVFTEYVFNGYKTLTDEEMKPDMIDYKCYSTTEMGTEAQIQACVDAIAKADLIYVHNDSANYFGKSSNDIPEMIKLQLCSAAVGDFVPFIIDGPIATQEIINDSTTTYSALVTNVFKKYGGRKYTYQWDPANQGTAAEYFMHQTSAYIQINGDNYKDKWTKVCSVEDYNLNNLPPVDTTHTDGDATPEDKLDRTKSYYRITGSDATIGRVLVINNSAADGAITTLVKSGITEFTGKCILSEYATEETVKNVTETDGDAVRLLEKQSVDGEQVPPIYNTENVKIYQVPNGTGLYNAYISRKEHPNYMSFEYYAADDAVLDDIDYSLYDLVIVEKDANLKTLSKTNYDHLVAAMNGNQHILYDKALVGSTTSTSSVVNYGDNYDYVCGKVMTSTESGKYDNILVTNGTRMSAYMSANNKDAVKDIADIINYASYRGIGGGEGDSSNLYTVLEIQPAYPIDTTLAQKLVNIDGKKWNEGGHIKNYKDPLEENNPWFANQLTFAKITGRTQTLTVENNYIYTANNSWYYLRNQGVINNTTSDEISFDGETSLTTFLEENRNISSSQLAAVTDYYKWTISKAKIAHATGLEYNQVNVIHMSTYEFNCTKKTLMDNFDAIYIGGDNSAIKSVAAYHGDKLSSIGLDKYNMYFTNGDAYDWSVNYGSSDGSVGTFIGNDLTELKYNELVSYKAAGMPIIIGKDAVAGLTTANAIDPDSRMYSFLTACQSDYAGGKTNIVWNFDYDDTVKIVNGGEYGNTYGGYVTVFAGTEVADYMGKPVTIDTSKVNEEDLKTALDKSSKRPKLVIKSAPVQYKEGDESSWITDHNLKWTYEAAGGSGFTARLIFDDNSNSRFDDDPVVRTEEGKSGTLLKTMDSDFFGVIYWKLEVENSDGLKASTTGCIKIKRTYQEKIKIDVLQIMPDEAMTNDDNSEQSLFLCTECQQRRNILKGNVSPTTAGTKYTPHVYNSIAGDRRTDDGGYQMMTNTTEVQSKINNFITNATNDSSPYYIKNLPVYGANGILADGDINEFEYSIKNNLGIHDHKFGIVKYDSEKYYGQDSITNGVDDWNTNWFTDVKFDYDVSLDILTLDEYEAMVEYTENIYKGMDTPNIETERSKNEHVAAEFEHAYRGMVKVINGTYKNDETNGGLTDEEKAALQKFMLRSEGFGLGNALTEDQINTINTEAAAAADAFVEEQADNQHFTNPTDRASFISRYWTEISTEPRSAYIERYVELERNKIIYANFETVMDRFAKAAPALDNYLIGLKGSAFANSDAATTLTEIEYELSSETYDERPYYDMFSLINTTNNTSGPVMNYISLYTPWRDAKLYEQYFKKMYQYFRFIAAVDDSGNLDLSKVYQCMLFGAARNFAGADIDSDEAINAIKRFVDNGGQAMLFYDTLTADSTVNMTSKLGPYFGVNTYSEPVDTSSTGTDDSTATEQYKGTIVVELRDQYNGTVYNTYTVDTAATTVKVNISYSGGYGSDSTSFSASDNSTNSENVGNYGKHDIVFTIEASNDQQYWDGGVGKIYINGQDCGVIKAGNASSSGPATKTFTIKKSNSIIKDTNTSGGSGSGGSTGPLALNPTKLTYRTGLEATTPGTNKSAQFNYLLYFAGGNASDESKTHPAKPLLKQAYEEKVEANAADLNNEGIVTMYPFSIGSNLRISPTVESDLTLKVDDPNLIVYYSLSGGTGGTMSTPYVADPHDGANNYFVYQYQPGGSGSGMVTYLGAGCTMVTGTHRENNDERRFFINLILNTGRKSTVTTTLSLYDHKSTQVVTSGGLIQSTNLVQGNVQPDGADYVMTILEGHLPEFSMILSSDTSIEIAEVYAYYDLDYNTNKDNEYHNNDNHVMIYDKKYNKSGEYKGIGYEDPWVASGYLMWVDKTTALKSTTATVVVNGVEQSQSMLTIEPRYIEPYNNEYTYIVVKVVDTKGKPHFKRIKIIIKPELHDLT